MAGEVLSVTLTGTTFDTTALPWPSAAIALSVAVPVAAGVQLMLQLPFVTVAAPPLARPAAAPVTPFTKTVTPATLPSASETVPLIWVVTPMGKNAPVAGALSPTVGGEPKAVAYWTETVF